MKEEYLSREKKEEDGQLRMKEVVKRTKERSDQRMK